MIINLLNNINYKLRYIILKSILGLLMSFILFFIFYFKIITFLIKKKIKQKNRLKNSLHIKKNNTITMGGIIILLSTILPIIIFINIYNKYILFSIITIVLYGIIGLIDDYIKVYDKYHNGLSILKKYLIQSIITIFIIYIIYNLEDEYLTNKIFIPFLNTKYININKFLYFILGYFTLIISINSFNITDGLDGLAIINLIISLLLLIFILYISSNILLSSRFNMLYIKNINELIILLSIIIGSSLGFLWFNSYPSNIFMGDTGSLSLGSILGLMFFLLRCELLLIISGILFIIEFISVIIQIIYYKKYKKRIYLMAPIHHHYEMKGIHECKIVFRFSIISIIFNIICFLIIIFRIL